jgi:hypothetical protein
VQKTYFILLILLTTVFCNYSFSQDIELIVIDQNSNLPIEDVSVNYVNSNDGTVSNSDGKFSVTRLEKILKISHISYETLFVDVKKLSKGDTLRLNPNVVKLEEVTVNSFNLVKAINYVLENYKKLYVNVPFEKDCILKETVTVNNEMKRFILSNISWWDKSYFRKKNDIKLRLKYIDYSKNIPLGIFSDVPTLNTSSNSGFAVPSTIINTIYLNTFLNSFISSTDDITSYVEKTTDEFIDVHFETEWKKSGASSYQHIGNFIFDKKTKAILNISFSTNQRGNIQKGIISKNNKESISETKSNNMRLHFSKTLNNRLSLKLYETEAKLDITYDDKIYNAIFGNKIYVLNEKAVKKVNNVGLINLTKPIFESLPSNTVRSSNSILLNEMENEFIFEDKK